MATSRTSVIFLWLLLCLVGLNAGASEQLEPDVEIQRVDSTIKVNATIELPVPVCLAYAVLTDYEKLPDYVPGILKIHAEHIAEHEVKVRQLGEVEVLFMHVQIDSVLLIDETPNQRIAFRQIEGDLKTYSGEWKLSETQTGTRISYDAALSFKGYAPMFMVRSVLRQELVEQFSGVAREAQARKEQAAYACGKPGHAAAQAAVRLARPG